MLSRRLVLMHAASQFEILNMLVSSQKRWSKTLGSDKISQTSVVFLARHSTACIIAFGGSYASLVLYYHLFCMRRMCKMLSSSGQQDQCLASGGAVILLSIQVILRWAALFISLHLSWPICIYWDTWVQCSVMPVNKLMH